MPLETPQTQITERIQQLNRRYESHGAISVLERALSDPLIGQAALVSSFGAESVVLLHQISILDRSLPVLFIDTELLFAETISYQLDLTEKFGLTNVNRITPERSAIFDRDPDGILQHFDPDACCALRKSEPLENALSGFDAWITGRKRYQGQTRQDLRFFESDQNGRIKINPLAHWAQRDLSDYIQNNNLPRHPLVSKGFLSIGCTPCTSPVTEGEDARAGRWRGLNKTECGIHFSRDGVKREAVS